MAVVLVMDIRHPLTPLDRELLGWLRSAERSTHVLLTKAAVSQFEEMLG